MYKLSKLRTRVHSNFTDLKARIQGNGIQAYWWTGEINFGDLITPALLNHYRLTPQLATARTASLVSTGSILQQLPHDYAGSILGSGIIKDIEYRLPNAVFLAVRGQLTRERVGAPPNTPLGDPGLLASRLMKREGSNTGKIGVIPHYSEAGNQGLKLFLKRFREEVKVIEVKQQPREVIREIAECRAVLSSSLHGIIVSHAVGIPVTWIKITDSLKGGEFKFKDYSSALGIDIDPVHFTGTETINHLVAHASVLPQATLREKVNELEGIFKELASRYRKQTNL